MADQIKIANIVVPEGRRPLNQERVAELAASIKVVGLQQPIGVAHITFDRHPDGRVSIRREPIIKLVHGRHRLAACRSLGWKEIETVNVGLIWEEANEGTLNDRAIEMMEIAENLHRHDLTTSERNEHLARWVELLEQQKPAGIGAAAPISKPGRKPSAAVAEVAKRSGLGTKTVKEAVAVSKVSPAVKDAADRAELSHKKRLAVSRMATEAEQLAAVEATREVRARAAAGEKVTVADVRAAKDHAYVVEHGTPALVEAVKRGDVPVTDAKVFVHVHPPSLQAKLIIKAGSPAEAVDQATAALKVRADRIAAAKRQQPEQQLKLGEQVPNQCMVKVRALILEWAREIPPDRYEQLIVELRSEIDVIVQEITRRAKAKFGNGAAP